MVSLTQLCIIYPKKSQALGKYYFEFGGGMSGIMAGSPLFGADAPTITTPGAAAHLNGFIDVSMTKRVFHFQIGAMYRLNSATGNSKNFGLQTLYPAIRLDFRYFYFTLGGTNLAMTRTGAALGFDGYKRVASPIAAIGEFGIEIKMIPIVYFILSSGVQVVKGPSGIGPRPAFDAMLGMRFYYGTRELTGGGGMNADDYEGWRYPFGKEKD